MPAKQKPTSFVLFWKTNKKPTDYYSIEAVQGIFTTKLVHMCTCTPSHTYHLTHMARDKCFSGYLYTQVVFANVWP